MKKQAIKTVLKCTRCGVKADLSVNLKAWNGWQVIDKKICPDCIAKEMMARQEAEEQRAQKLQVALLMLEMQS